MGRTLLVVGLALVWSAAGEARAQSRTWELNDKGSWSVATQQQPPPQAPTALPPNPTLDHGHDLYVANKFDEAHDLVLDWLKKNPKAPDRDRGMILLAEIYYVQGKRLEAFYQCDELLDNAPESRLFFPTLQLQFRIADEYLKGYKNTFFGVRLIPMDDAAIEMLFRIQERAPGSPIAEQALQRSADFYYHTSQFDMAADAYGAFLRIYPRSPESARARLRQAYSNFAQYRGPRYDATPLLDARAQFVDIIAQTPDLAQEEGVQQFIDRIDEQLAAKIASDADFYVRSENLKGAVFLYRSLIARYPNSKDAESAKKILETMPASALAGDPPPASAGQLPTSRPVFGP